MKFYKTIEMHFYFGSDYFPDKPKSLDEVVRMMEVRCIEKNIMMNYLCLYGDFRIGNTELFKAIQDYKELYGYCYINGHYLEDSKSQMLEFLPEEKCRGIKFHPEYSGLRPDDKRILPLFEKLAHEYDKPALIHSWPYGEHGNPQPYSHPSFIVELAKILPKLKIIMGHMGGPSWLETIEIAKPYSNVYLDMQGSYTHFDKVKAAVDALGADRVMFGSGGSFDTQLGVVYDSEISDDDKKSVLYGTAKRVFGL